jgi:hypothetical protein
LTLTIVLTFARVFSGVGIDEIVNERACCIGCARSICTHSDGTGQKAGNCRSRDDRFRWVHEMIFFRDSWVLDPLANSVATQGEALATRSIKVYGRFRSPSFLKQESADWQFLPAFPKNSLTILG